MSDDLSLLINIAVVDAASGIVRDIANSIKDMAGDGVMGALTAGALGAAGAIVGIGTASVEAAGTFQQSMNMLVTSAGESQSNIQQISDGIIKMSADTGTATNQLSQAMYMIESTIGTTESGAQRASDALTMLTAAAQGAKTENASLQTVATALTTVLTDYHMKATDATAAMDGLVATVQNGRTNLENLARSMGAVLPVASSLNISFPQVAGALATLTNAGYTAQNASQNLAHVLVALQAPSKIAESAMIDVGLSAQQVRDALVSQGLPEALQLIEEHVGKKFPEGSVQGEQALKAILGGLVGLKIAAALTGDSLKTTEANIKSVTTAMQNASDSVMGWEVVQEGFNFQLDRVKAAFSGLVIVIGQQLLPIVTPVVAAIANMLEGIMTFAQGLNTAGTQGGLFGSILQSIGVSSDTVRQLLVLLNQTAFLLQTTFGTVGYYLQQVFGAALEFVGGLIRDFITNSLPGIIEKFNEFLMVVQNVMNTAIAAILGFFDQVQAVFSIIGPIFDNLAASAFNWGANFMNGFGNGVMTALDSIIAVVMQVITEIEAYLGFASPTRKGPGQNVYKWGQGLLSGFAMGMLQGIPQVVDAAGNAMSVTVLSAAGNQTVSPTNSAANKSMNGLGSQLNAGAGIVGTAVNSIGSQLDAICKKHAQPASNCAAHNLTAGLASKLHGGSGQVGSAANHVGKQHHGVAIGAGHAAHLAAKHVTTDHAGRLHAGAHHVRTAAHHIGAQHHHIAGGAKKAAGDAAAAVAGALPQQLKLGEKNVGDAATKVGESIANGILSPIHNVGNGIKNALQSISPIVQNILGFFRQIGNVIQQVATAVTPGLVSIWHVIQNQLWPSIIGLWNAISPLVGGILQLVGVLVKAAVEFGNWVVQSGALKIAWDIIVGTIRVIISILSVLIDIISATLKPIINQIIQTFKDQLVPSFAALWKSIQPLLPSLAALAEIIGAVLLVALGIVVAVLSGILQGLAYFVAGLVRVFGGIVQIVAGFVTLVLANIAFMLDLFTGNFNKLPQDLANMWEGIKLIFAGAIQVIFGIIQSVFGLIIGFVLGFITTIISYFQRLYDALVGHSIVPDMVNGIVMWFNRLLTQGQQIVTNIVKFFTDGFNNLLLFANGTWNRIVETFKLYTFAALYIVNGFWNQIKNIFSSAWGSYVSGPLNNLFSNVQNWFSNLASSMYNWGVNLMHSLANGIYSAMGAVTGAASDAARQIASYLGIHSPTEKGPLNDLDQWMPNMMSMFEHQIRAGIPDVETAVNMVSTSIIGINPSSNKNSAPPPMRSTPPQQMMNITFELDGKPIGKFVSNYISKEMRIQGGLKSK